MTHPTSPGPSRAAVPEASTPPAQERSTDALTPMRRPTRDRRGRGLRGPGVMPLAPGSPTRPSARARFDADVLAAVRLIEERWHAHLPLVEYAVEDTPLVPDGWDEDEVPLSSLVTGHGATPHQVVVFRRPVERRTADRSARRHLVMTLLVAHVADLLNLPADDVDPRGR